MIKYNKESREKGKTPIEQTQLILLEILKVVDAICRKHDINYWLTGGTLLGAVRHKGFIPWDDDFDIAMERNDYNRFMEVAPGDLPDDLYFQTNETDPTRKSKWLKIRDNYSSHIQKKEIGKNIKYHQGIFFDVFPYDALEKDFFGAKIFLNRKFQKSKFPVFRKMRWLFNQCATIPVKLIGYKNLQSYFLHKYGGDNPKLLSTGIDVSTHYYTTDYSTVFPLGEMDFMGVKAMVPGNVEKYLTEMYGDYMKIPDEKDRGMHAYELLPFTKCNHPAARQY